MSQLLICARNMITAEMFARQMFIQKFRMVLVPSGHRAFLMDCRRKLHREKR